MSSHEFSPSVDALVMAGTRGVRPFGVDPAVPGKPFLSLGGEPLIRRVVRAALGAKRIGKVLVVGDLPALQRTLEPLAAPAGRLQLIAEGEDLMDNIYRAFFLHLLPAHGLPPATPRLETEALARYREEHPAARELGALFLTADLPFLAAEDLDHFLEHAPASAGFVLGLVDHRGLIRMQRELGEQTGLEQWKLGGLLLRGGAVRINNLFLVRPLAFHPALYSGVTEVYAHRWLLKQDGSIHWHNWWALGRAVLRHAHRAPGRLRFWRGLLNFVPAVMCFGLARLTHRLGRVFSWPFRQLLGQRDLEAIGTWLAGAEVRMCVTEDLGPAIDIDVEESYRSLANEGEENFRRVARYLGRVPAVKEPDPIRQMTGGHS
jgi:GTP:adenosylcobinamide-phosphate guanylyltransferase